MDVNRSVRYQMSIMVRCVELMQMMKNCENIEQTVRLASAFALTPDEHVASMRKVESREMPLPSRQSILRAAVRINFAACHYDRLLFREALQALTQWISQFGGDSSPQRRFDFMNCVEERFILRGGPVTVTSGVQRSRTLKVL